MLFRKLYHFNKPNFFNSFKIKQKHLENFEFEVDIRIWFEQSTLPALFLKIALVISGTIVAVTSDILQYFSGFLVCLQVIFMWYSSGILVVYKWFASGIIPLLISTIFKISGGNVLCVF